MKFNTVDLLKNYKLTWIYQKFKFLFYHIKYASLRQTHDTTAKWPKLTKRISNN